MKTMSKEKEMKVRQGIATSDPLYSDTFKRIPRAKQERILRSAIAEFADQGYNAANINHIAADAEISIGSLYTYFDSKEKLFLAVVDLGRRLLDEVMERVQTFSRMHADFNLTLEYLFTVALEYSRLHPDFCRIYLDLSTEKLSSMAGALADNLEFDYIAFYRQLLLRAKECGEIKDNLDLDLACFMLDDLVVILQFSSSSTYYRERIKAYLGSDVLDSPTELAKRLTAHLKNSWSL